MHCIMYFILVRDELYNEMIFEVELRAFANYLIY